MDVADLGGDRVAEHPRDPGRGHQQRDIAVVGARRREARGSISAISVVEIVDHRDRGEHSVTPRLRELEPLEQLAPGAPNRSRHRAGVPERHQLRVHAVLERGAFADQEQPPAGPLALRP